MMARMSRLESPDMAIKPRSERTQRIRRARAMCLHGDLRLVIAQRMTIRMTSSKAEIARPLMVKTVNVGILSQGIEM